ncbi:MAG TPA: hypothetical protein VKA13_06940, partial [Gammaproteobacteria bacterium]|nr:hypothetical protein [Gammaproteobacteria bacterium]
PTPPLPSIGGAATGLNKPCGIDVADSQGTSQSTTYVFVANAGSDSVTIYDRADVAQSSDGNVAPTFTISGSGSRLSSPCGIRVDASKNEIYVANTGTYGSNFQLSSVTVYTWTADTNGAITNVQLDRTLSSGVNSALTAPTAILLQGGLWVADRGAQPAMTHLPAIYPSPASGQAANAPLTGKYNVILYGVDLSKGINGLGYQIPTLFAERGIANFNPAASPWPAFNLRVDTESRRTVIDRGCVQEDVGGLPKEGFYGVGDDGSFYAFNEGDHGSLRGAYLPDGRAFTGSFYNSSNKLFVIYGIKDTNLSTAYLGTDGTQTGGIAPYAYTVYSNDIIGIHRFESPPQTDLFRYQLLVGAASASHSRFEGVSADGNLNTLTNPMGDFAVPQSSGVIYRTGLTNLGPRPYSPQAGGQFEDQDTTYGMAGAISASGSTMLFMNNISNLDSDSCPAKAGVGVGLRQTASKAFSNNDLKGTFFVAGFGDQFQSLHLPDLYLTEAGTLTFDGTNSVTMSFDMNNQGHALVDQGTLTYQVTTRTMPASQNSAVNATVNVVDLFGSDKSIPFATAIIGEDGKTLAFYRNLVQPNTGPPPTADPVRFLGLALYQHP